MEYEQDSLRRFIFENEHIRGEWVCCHASYQAVLSRHPYPASVGQLLGQALATSVLLAATIKFQGALSLQVQSKDYLKLLLAQCTHDLHVRGLAQYQEDSLAPADSNDLSSRDLLSKGQLMIAIDQSQPNQPQQRYQGIVDCQGQELAHIVEQYFLRSEQLPTRLWLAANSQQVCGLLLQQMPFAGEPQPEAWQNIITLTETLTPAELLNENCESLLVKLYHERKVRLFEPQLVSFRCQCNTERMEKALKMMTYEEVQDILNTYQQVDITCEFCNAKRTFDRVDVERLFKSGLTGSGSQH